MRIRSWVIAAASPGLLHAQTRASSSAAATRAFANVSSEIRGEIPPAPCGSMRGADEPGIVVESFDEVTPVGASASSGVFEITVATTCVAPFYQALFAHESLNIRFAFTDADRRPANESLVLANARLTHVDIVGTPDSRAPFARIGITAARVATSDVASGTSAHRRERAVSFRAAASERIDDDASGEAWVHGGVDGVSVRLASSAPAMTTEFTATDWNLSVRAPSTRNGASTSTLRITLDQHVKLTVEQRTQLDAAADARALLTRALLEVVNAQGTSGITIRLKNVRLAREGHQSIDLAAKELTVTDVASGRTASTP